MSDGQVVGTISIKVTPDTKHFRRELKAELEAVTKEIEGSVKVNADFDANGLKEKVAAAAKAAKAEIPVKADVKSLDLFQKRMLADLAKAHKSLETKIPIDVDGESLRRTTAQIVKDLENETKRKLPVDLELATGQREKILAEVEAIKKLAAVEPIKLKLDPEKDFRLHQRVNAITQKIKPELDESEFAKALAEARAQAKLAGVKLDVDFKDGQAERKLAELIAKLKVEAKLAKIKINVDVERGIKGRLHQLGDGLQSLASSAGSKLTGFFRSLSDDTTLLAVAITAFLAPALSLVTGALLALPAIIAGVLVPIGALVLGFDGIKKAAEAAGLIGEGKKGKTTLGKVLTDLRASLADTFQTGFTPIFEKLTTLAPVVADGLKPIAQRLVDMAKGVTDVVTSSAGMAAIKNIFDNIATAMQVATPGMAKFTEAFLGLVSGGSNSLPKFASLFTQMGTSFSDWITKITTPDKLQGKALTSPLDRALDGFINVLKTAGPIISDLFSKAFDFLSDPNKVHQMMDFFNNLRHLLNGLFEISAGIFQVLTNVFNWFQNVADFIRNLGTTIGQNFANLFSGDILSGLGAALGAQFDVIWSGIVAGASAAWSTITGIVSMTVTAWSGFFSGIWDGIVSGAQDAWNKVTVFWSNLGSQVTSLFSGIDFNGMWNGLVEAAQQVWGQLVTTVSGACDNVTTLVTSLPGRIVGAMGNLGGALVGAGRALMDGLLSGIKSGLQSVLDFASGIAAKIAAVKGPLPKDRTTLTPAGQALMQGLQDGIEGGLEGVLNRASQIAAQISDVMRTGLIPQGLKDDLKREMDELRLEYDQLKVQKDALDPKDKATKPQRDVLTEQMRQVQTIRDQLKLQSDQLGFSEKYGENQDNITQQFGQQLSKLKDIGFGFAQANISQLQSDLGMSGNGAVEGLANAGIGWLSSMLGNMITGAFGGNGQGGVQIQVNSVDEALQARQNLINRQALGVAGR